MKPIIMTTTNYTCQSKFAVEDMIGFPGQEWHVLAEDYIREIEKAGGLPLMMPVYKLNEELDGILEIADGFLFTGGRDTDPAYFGEDFTSKITSNNPYRDRWEYALAKKLLFESDIPVLGICRGIQILNVAAGGTLYQDLTEGGSRPSHVIKGAPSYHPVHDVKLSQDSRLRKIMDKDVIRTNSLHSMAVKDVGRTLKVTGITKDGVVEVVEQQADRYLMAVQFHPEVMTCAHPELSKIYQSLVDASAEYKRRKK
jgi:putative glutamine amidotransferase